MKLAGALNDFQAFLLNADEAILPEIISDDRLSAKQRLAVYYDAYRIRLMEALKADFEKTHTLLGDELFEQACLAYLDKFPSTHFSVRYFGRSFVEFLSTELPFKNHSLTAEMALFEWTIGHTLDAEDAPLITIPDLSAINPDLWAELTFRFHPSVQFVHFHWDTPQLWQHIDAEKPPRDPVYSETPIAWLFWRKEIKSLYQSLTPMQAALYQGITQGQTFGDLCEVLSEKFDNDQTPLMCAQTLYQWVNDHLLCEYKLLESVNI